MDERECSICLEHLDGLIVKLACNHLYHGKCIERWFNYSLNDIENTCPECNDSSNIIDVIEIPLKKREKIVLKNLLKPKKINKTKQIYKKISDNEISINEISINEISINEISINEISNNEENNDSCKKKCLNCIIL